MAEEADGLRRHFILDGVTETEPYRYPGSGGGAPSEVPARNRDQHGGALQRQIGELRGVAEVARDAQQAAGMEDGLGLQVEFESFPEIELAFESLARDHWGIELLNVLIRITERGTAAVLASRGAIAVYPTAGWWKTRYALERYDKAARYALVVSIKAPEVDVDLCTEVANRIAVGVEGGL